MVDILEPIAAFEEESKKEAKTVRVLLALLYVYTFLFLVLTRKMKLGWVLNLAYFFLMTLLMASLFAKKILAHQKIGIDTFTDLRTNTFFMVLSGIH